MKLVGQVVSATVTLVEEYGAWMDYEGATILAMIIYASAEPARMESLCSVGERRRVRILRYASQHDQYVGSFLGTGGLPTEVRLEGYVGPTFFTSEPARQLSALCDLPPTHPHTDALVIGTVRDDDRAVSAFCVDESTGHVVLVDLDAPNVHRFVNSNVGEFATCLEILVGNWRALVGENHAKALELVRSQIDRFDRPAMSDANYFCQRRSKCSSRPTDMRASGSAPTWVDSRSSFPPLLT